MHTIMKWRSLLQKLQIWCLCLLLILQAILVFAFPPASAQMCYYCEYAKYAIYVNFEKAIYSPDELVPIHVSSGGHNPVYLTIRDGMGPYFTPEARYNLTNARVLFSTTVNLVNGSAVVNAKIPTEDPSIYRFLVIASDATDKEQQEISGLDRSNYGMFYTKQDADKIAINGFSVDTRQLEPGGKLFFKAKVLDGVGNPLPSVWVAPIIRNASDGAGVLDFSYYPYAKSDSDRGQYLSDGTVSGYFSIPSDFKSGTYYAQIGAGIEPGGYGEAKSANFQYPPADPTTENNRRGLHDYSINTIVSDLSPPAPIFRIKRISNADSVVLDGSALETRRHFSIKGPSNNNQPYNQTANPSGYFEITIPHAWLGGNYTVLVNDVPISDYNMTYNRGGTGADSNGDSTTIAFNYDGVDAKSVDILGTTAIPEFKNLTNLTIAGIAGLVAILIKIRHFRNR